MRLSPLLFTGVVGAAGLAGLVVVACASSAVTIDPETAEGGTPAADGGGTDARRDDAAVAPDTAADAAPSTCAITRAYVLACGEELTCGNAKFDAWCAQNDVAINSESYRRAQASCLTKDNCDGKKRRDCEYRTYATATPTAAQKAVVAAYCQTCEPSDAADCAIRKTTYDPAAGIESVDDVFVAAWELADPLVDEIRTKCTGSALDAGTATGACLKAFASCAGDIYVDRLPDCP